jgi:putative FmdB family regulatory protein
MPIYEYDCPKCGTFELSRKMSDPELTVHEACGSPVSRRMSLTSFALKGGGWYSDGYSSTSSSKSDGPSCGASGGGCSSGSCPMA